MKRREQSPSPPHEEYSFPAPAGFFDRAFCAVLFCVMRYFLSRFAYCVVLCTVLFFAYGIILCVPQTAWRVLHGMYGISPWAGPAPGAFCASPRRKRSSGIGKRRPVLKNSISARRNGLRCGKGCAKIEPRNRNTNNETRIRKQKGDTAR